MKIPKRLIFILLLQIILFSLVAYLRFIDVDEGYYLTASRLIAEGKLPYVDFFYTQMPLMPYIYGAWMQVFGFTWFSARMLSVIFCLFTSLILIGYIYKKTGDEKVTIIASLLLVFNGQIISWFSTAKTYSLTMFFLMASFVLLGSSKKRHILTAGFFLGLACNTRLMMLPLAFISVIWLVMCRCRQGFVKAAKDALFFFAGFLPSCLVSLYLLMKNPDSFLFDNLIFHITCTGMHGYEALMLKFKSAYRVFTRPQFFILFIALLGTSIIARDAILRRYNTGKYKEEFLAFAFFVVIFIVSLMPPGAHEQYFVMTIPFLIILSCPFIQNILQNKKNILYSVAMALMIVYVIFSAPSTGVMGGIGITSNDKWTWRNAGRIAQGVQRLTDKEDLVLSWWPGYTFLAHWKNLPGMENEFGGMLGRGKISYEDMKKYKIASKEVLAEAIKSGVPKVVIWDSLYTQDNGKKDLEMLIKDRYRLAVSIDDTALYVARQR